MVICWILNSLDPDISQSVICSKIAKGIWDELNQQYSQFHGARMYEVQKDLTSVSQGSYDVAENFNKVKKLWDEMGSLGSDSYCVCECTYSSKRKMIKKEQNQKLMQFLMGLNEVFNNVRGNILMIEPLPEVNKAYSVVMQDEKQRGIQNVPHFQLDIMSFFVGSSQRQNPNSRSYPKNFPNQEYNFNNQRAVSDPKRQFCNYCKKSGHTIDKYYKLNGFPQYFNFRSGNKTKRVVANVHANVQPSSEAKTECSHDFSAPSPSAPTTITPEQYKQLMSLLQNVQGPFSVEAIGIW